MVSYIIIHIYTYKSIDIRVNTCYNRNMIRKGEKNANTPKQMIKLLKQNGFREVRQVGSHITLENSVTGKMTTVPYHCKDLKKGTEQVILKQAGLK